jgi:3-methyladenine DNA glycosylase AlkD
MPETLTAAALVRALAAALAPLADPARAQPMSAYMRDRFAFLGIATPARRNAVRFLLRDARSRADEATLWTAAQALWRKREREYQYVAVDMLVGCERALSPRALPMLATLVTTKSWWDTVDGLAANVVGPLVSRNPGLRPTVDAWSGDDNPWLRRTALLHQLRYGSATDAKRLFAYCVANAADPDFFVRKAIGWALRQYAYADAPAARSFLEAEQQRLSPLSLREAGKHLSLTTKRESR